MSIKFLGLIILGASLIASDIPPQVMKEWKAGIRSQYGANAAAVLEQARKDSETYRKQNWCVNNGINLGDLRCR